MCLHLVRIMCAIVVDETSVMGFAGAAVGMGKPLQNTVEFSADVFFRVVQQTVTKTQKEDRLLD